MHVFLDTGRILPRRIEFMSEYQESNPTVVSGTPRWVGLAVAVLGALSLLGLGVGWSAINHANSVEKSTQTALKQQDDSLGQRLSKTEEENQQLQSDLKVVTDKLNVTQADLIAARKQNKLAAMTYGKKLNELGSNVNAQLATKASSDDVNKLGGELALVANCAFTFDPNSLSFLPYVMAANLFCLRAAIRSACVTFSLSVTTFRSLCSCWFSSSVFESRCPSESSCCFKAVCVDFSTLLA